MTVRSGRAFLRGLIDLSTSAKWLDHFVHLSMHAWSHIEWWYQFAGQWNGRSTMEPSKKLAVGAIGHLRHFR